MTKRLKKHYCVGCGKDWECPSGNKCKLVDEIMCSNCMNIAKKEHLITEFGEGKQDE